MFFYTSLSSIVARNEIHVILTIHTVKQSPHGGDPTSAVAGSSKFTQLAQNVLMIQRHDPAIEDEVYNAFNSPVEHKLTVTVAKSRSGLSGQKFAFDFMSEGPCFREHGLIKLAPSKRRAGQ